MWPEQWRVMGLSSTNEALDTSSLIVYVPAWGSGLIREHRGQKRSQQGTEQTLLVDHWKLFPCWRWRACVHDVQITTAINLPDWLVFDETTWIKHERKTTRHILFLKIEQNTKLAVIPLQLWKLVKKKNQPCCNQDGGSASMFRKIY